VRDGAAGAAGGSRGSVACNARNDREGPFSSWAELGFPLGPRRGCEPAAAQPRVCLRASELPQADQRASSRCQACDASCVRSLGLAYQRGKMNLKGELSNCNVIKQSSKVFTKTRLDKNSC